MDERKAIRVHIIHECGLMHEGPYCKMGKYEPVELLSNQVRRFAAKHDSGPPQMGFEFIKSRLDFPSLMIQGCQFLRRSLVRVQDCGHQTVDFL